NEILRLRGQRREVGLRGCCATLLRDQVCGRDKKAEEQKSSENCPEAFTRRNLTHTASDIRLL
ncbi:MAG TPA: hypothetical protein VKB58_15685, partial [Terriglobales bacterium]|nr:hypothetical protein [Terriglobales bacterium]